MFYYYRSHFGSSCSDYLQPSKVDTVTQMTTCPMCREAYGAISEYDGKIIFCVICLDETDDKTKITRLACKHEFCSECYRNWDRRGRGRSMTPPPIPTDPRSQTPPPRPRTYTPPPGPSRRRNRNSSPDPFQGS